ncbi:MAG TPA: AAA family ATPase, partial [Candidatus Nanoarchaeia archaeon]|nr:AAA family ATPase [Candidatus Nanoarchaeia archaeon]
MTTHTLEEPTFVGRKCEFEELQHFLEAAISGSGNTIFISGEAGSGKTRLMTEFLKFSKTKGVNVLTGWCLSNAAVPYFPFTEAFETNFSAEDSGSGKQKELKSALLELNREFTNEVSPQTWKDTTFAIVARELLQMSTQKPLILFIDDLHWADSASLSLLHYISRNLNAERILVIATFRKEELSRTNDDLSKPAPLAEMLRLMGRDGLFHEVKLGSIHQDEIRQIAEGMLGGNINKCFAGKLEEESLGNPLFIVETLRLLSKQGHLVRENNEWITTVEKFEVPAKVKDVVLRRLESLTPFQRRVLGAASAIGNKFDPELLAAVISRDSLDVLESLDAISKTTLLVHPDGKLYRFNHAKYQEMLYEEIPHPQKTHYHLLIAKKIESTLQNPGDRQT